MITENGIVTEADPLFARIRTTRSSACGACSSRQSCGIVDSGKQIFVTVKNTLHVKAGDHVVIGLETRPMLFLSFLLYVFPILLLIVGALIGNSLAPLFNLNPSAVAMISGFLWFGSAIFIIRKNHRTLSKNEGYKPFLVRKKPIPSPTGCSAA